MKLDIAAVISLDGKLTRHNETDIHSWVSDEDQQHFLELKKNHQVLIMGSNIYVGIRDNLQLDGKNLRIILTHHPEEYKTETVPGKLEFHTKTPAELVTWLKSKDYESALIVGGGQMITDFLKTTTVDKLYLTIEPHLFGGGMPLISEEVSVNLKLAEYLTLNERGTLALVYRVL